MRHLYFYIFLKLYPRAYISIKLSVPDLFGIGGFSPATRFSTVQGLAEAKAFGSKSFWSRRLYRSASPCGIAPLYVFSSPAFFRRLSCRFLIFLESVDLSPLYVFLQFLVLPKLHPRAYISIKLSVPDLFGIGGFSPATRFSTVQGLTEAIPKDIHFNKALGSKIHGIGDFIAVYPLAG